ncbi:MAG: glycoside hydrolase family 13 protein [Eubacteriales bacterium]|nr:glycoside hydrolase family 13 protein [Eubacteriales bacterium]MDD3863841.1 glycoside hydrolase family 13 protein [Eubacteriales bacterium]
MLIYDPFDSMHKMPPGAVVPSEKISFNVILPEDYDAFYPIYFMIQKDGELWCEYRCEEIERTAEGAKRIGTMWEANVEGLYFYKFCTKREDGTVIDETSVFQQTVYKNNFMTPEWLRGAIMYQIFPDRFKRSGKTPLPKQKKTWIFRETWGEDPVAGPDESGIVRNNDFFGGDLAGIEEELPYLSGLGVSVIYLNPIFRAYSNHRYDTADYEAIDPLLGTEEDFARLCKNAKKHGIRVILDGVFNHTGSHSRYFNKDGVFDCLGAFQSKESPFFNWYSFTSWPEEYDCWWGIDTLPNLREENPEVLDFMIRGENSVIARWLRAGASGFRLDVADELPDGFLDALRIRVKEIDPEACIIGEVWEDASNKISYGARRRYLTGDQLDTVMNYPLKDGILNFLNGTENGAQLAGRVAALREHYPKPAYMTLMNILGTHDTPRLRTVLTGEGSDAAGKEKLFSALMIWAFMPGMASIYYGDEIGMEGGRDPMNRRCFQPAQADAEIKEYYKNLLTFRQEITELKNMDLAKIQGEQDSFGFSREGDRGEVRVLIHRGLSPLEKLYERAPDKAMISGDVTFDGSRIRMNGPSCVALYFRKI